MEDQKEQVNELLEDGWFFGNSLMSRSRLSKMVRCNSDPCPSSSAKEETLNFQDIPKMSDLFRTPSLPPSFCRDTKVEQVVDEEEEEPRMGDLIRQAMPMPIAMPNKKLNRAPSLPPCRSKEAINMLPNIQNGVNEVRKLARTSIDSLVLLPEKGAIEGIKLTRRASVDSFMLLPPKYASKGTKQGGSNCKNRPQRKQLDLTMMDEPSKSEPPKAQTLDKNKSQKSLTDLEIEELQGFKDLGFSFDPKQVNPSVAQILPALQRQGSLDSTKFEHDKVVRRPYLSESWEWRSTSPALATPKLKRVDQKPGSAEDMKAQIKFWAKAVVSNVRQEC